MRLAFNNTWNRRTSFSTFDFCFPRPPFRVPRSAFRIFFELLQRQAIGSRTWFVETGSFCGYYFSEVNSSFRHRNAGQCFRTVSYDGELDLPS